MEERIQGGIDGGIEGWIVLYSHFVPIKETFQCFCNKISAIKLLISISVIKFFS
jgi:hypothetical protein